MEPARRLPMTEEEFLQIPESLDHIELIDGEVHMAPAPTFDHQNVLLRLVRLVDAWARANPPAVAAFSPLDIRMAPGRILQPDAMLWLGGLADRSSPITTIPDLVVEVLSGKPSYDRLTKKLIYFEAGVREYWIVDPILKTFEIAHGLETRAPSREPVFSTVAPGLQVDPEEIFREG